jgi:hypothetical protein
VQRKTRIAKRKPVPATIALTLTNGLTARVEGEKQMFTNELKKGTIVILRNGWRAILEDNKKGNIRDATVEGFYSERGSIYGHNIISAIVDGNTVTVQHTPAQKKMQAEMSRFPLWD